MDWRSRQNYAILYPKRPKVFGESQPLSPPLFVLFPRWRWTYKREGRGLEGHTQWRKGDLWFGALPPTIQPFEPGAPDRLCLISKPSPPSPPPISPLLQPTQRDTFDMTRDTLYITRETRKECHKGIAQNSRTKKVFYPGKKCMFPSGLILFIKKEEEGTSKRHRLFPLSPS